MDSASRTAAPYGTWASPLAARDIAAAALGLSYATAHDGRLYWIESRPTEQGRSALMAATPGGPAVDVTPAKSNVRSRVHEYGGRPYTVACNVVTSCRFAFAIVIPGPGVLLPV